MPLGSNHVTTTTAATFIPEIWSDEIVASYKKNKVRLYLKNYWAIVVFGLWDSVIGLFIELNKIE